MHSGVSPVSLFQVPPLILAAVPLLGYVSWGTFSQFVLAKLCLNPPVSSAIPAASLASVLVQSHVCRPLRVCWVAWNILSPHFPASSQQVTSAFIAHGFNSSAPFVHRKLPANVAKPPYCLPLNCPLPGWKIQPLQNAEGSGPAPSV